jgi:hypothetical protein
MTDKNKEIISAVKSSRNKQEILIPIDEKGKPFIYSRYEKSETYNRKGKIENQPIIGKVTDIKI